MLLMEVWHRDLVPSTRRRDWDAAPIKMWRVSLTNFILALCWRFLWIFGREAFQGSLHWGKEIIVKSSLVAGYPASSSEDLLQTGWRLKSSCHHLWSIHLFLSFYLHNSVLETLSSMETCIVLHIHCQSTAFFFREIEPFWDLLKEKHQAANFALKTDHEAKEFTNPTWILPILVMSQWINRFCIMQQLPPLKMWRSIVSRSFRCQHGQFFCESMRWARPFI